MRFISLLTLLLVTSIGFAQKAEIYGVVLDKEGKAFDPPANIALQGFPGGTVTNAKGQYKLSIPANKTVIIQFSHVSVKPKTKSLQLTPNQRLELNISLEVELQIDTFKVVSNRRTYDGLTLIDPIKFEAIPAPNGDPLSTFIKGIPGVYSNNELSSQYSVRGGNFDENMVYVNGIEIQRPMLIKAGQQEGLNFANADLVDKIEFSAGGFSAAYGDKMASVMDVKYKNPKEFAGSFSGSLLGGSFHLEGASLKQRLRYLMGLRYKSNQYILRTIDTQGSYNPSFIDLQFWLGYTLSDNWEVSFLGNYALNKYQIIPQTRETNFGTIFEALRFTVYFDGQEIDRFENYTGALHFNYRKRYTNLQFTSSLYRTSETESYDILGQYWLDVLENDLGKDDFGEVAFNKGVGAYLNHARNVLNGWIVSAQHRGEYKQWKWGAEIRHDLMEDRLSEWKMIDSAGYSLPNYPDNIGNANPNFTAYNALVLNDLVKAKQQISSNRYSAFIMYDWNISKSDTSTQLTLNAGLRVNYWDFSNELLPSPRVSLLIQPSRTKKISYRIAAGIYSQPPFYREMRYHDGSINTQIKAQKSAQLIAGADLLFTAWDRPFKFTSEAYFKYIWDLIPYEMEDVRLRYFAENNAFGFASGIDFKLHGELVEDAESWIGISLMKTMENLKGDYYYQYYNAGGELIQPGLTIDNKVVDSSRVEPGFIPRPTDQRVTFNLFFQDYIPGYPTFKVHLNLVFATGLPYGPPTHQRYQQTRRYPPYRRVDIGFSKQLIGEDTKFKSQNPFRHFKNAWISVEVFNLLQIDNTLSYMWITDVTGTYYSIPNYLTSRQLNLKLSVKF
jgi:hypothetical protein